MPNRQTVGAIAIRIPAETLELLTRLRAILAAHGAEGFLVGGAVRDLVIPRATADIDVAATGNARQLAEAIAKALQGHFVPLDEERHVYRVVLSAGTNYIDLSALQGTLRQDLLRRDFTINALALPLERIEAPDPASRIVDPTGGLQDIAARRIRLVSEQALSDDPIRLLRAVRQAAELDFVIDPGAEATMRREAHRIAGVSPERVRDEFCRILGHIGAAARLQQLDDYRLLTAVIPELEASRDCGQPKEHYWDVLQHSMQIVGYVEHVARLAPPGDSPVADIPWNETFISYFTEKVSSGRSRLLLLKLSALLHDVSKPATKTIEPNGRIRFFGHPQTGADVTRNIMERLRFSNRETRIVVSTVLEHLRPGLISREPQGPTKRAVYRFYRDAGEAAVDTLFLSYADYLAARGPLLEEQDWKQYSGRISGILEAWRQASPEAKPPKLIDGHDLIEELALDPGPNVGALLEAIYEAEAAGEVTTYDQAIALAKRLREQAR